ncbi:hypothetical protein KBK19_15065 [Microvirga sp. STR05]|uniref:Uncharacterized protein n=1 Tax=Hymenobacter duratus TaxID=2771356 RepID=A0ABR8JHP7_9BACT|nr:hypothetical protein [Hymenobacter duratus]MBD2716359.1 hypothetical protein [Hymenobacter duratus]MBR7951274.1 hypothetical protein [Microvirga sp. STR05]
MLQQLRPYKDSPTRHDVWLRSQGYTKSIVRNGGQPADSGNQYTPQHAIL